MVQARDDDFVAGAELLGQRATEHECQTGHVVAEHDFAGVCAEQVRGCLSGAVDDGVRAAAGLEDAVRVGVAAHKIVVHGVDDAPGNLRAARVVEEDGGPAVVCFL